MLFFFLNDPFFLYFSNLTLVSRINLDICIVPNIFPKIMIFFDFGRIFLMAEKWPFYPKNHEYDFIQVLYTTPNTPKPPQDGFWGSPYLPRPPKSAQILKHTNREKQGGVREKQGGGMPDPPCLKMITPDLGLVKKVRFRHKK